MKGYIYKLTNPIGQIYIGQTKDLARRMESYRTMDCVSQKLLYVSLKRYGFDAHTVQILKECRYTRLDYWEIKFINEHKSCYRDNRELGLNILKESYEEYCKLRGEAKTRATPQVAQYTMDDKLVKVWKSAAIATRRLKLKKGNITKVLRGDFTSAGGYKWKYYASEN